MTSDAAALGPWGFDARVASLLADAAAREPGGAAGAVPGRVVRVEKGGIFVRVAAGERLVTAPPVAPAAAVGDWVLVDDRDGALAVRHVAERWSALTRRDPDTGTDQVLAADIDLVLVIAPLDRLRLARIERELLLGWASGATPVVVLTKADLVADPERARADAARRLDGADIVATSTRTGAGIDALAARLRPSATAVLFGPSGAGKSSLANALVGDDLLATGDVREADRRGRHTTTSRQLVPVPGGGVLIDTPGLRSLSVLDAEHGLAVAFADLEALAKGCRFSDCRHDTEPGCAVTAAVRAGGVDERRAASYRKLRAEAEDGVPARRPPGSGGRRRPG